MGFFAEVIVEFLELIYDVCFEVVKFLLVSGLLLDFGSVPTPFCWIICGFTGLFFDYTDRRLPVLYYWIEGDGI